MENKIKELIEKYYVKITEEPLHYEQWVEIFNDLRGIIENENTKNKTVGK